MIPALAHVSTLNSPLDRDIEDYAAGKCPAIEFWWGKLDAFLKAQSPDALRRLLETHELSAPVISFVGGLLVSQHEARREAWELFGQRLETAKALGVQTLVLAADVHGPLGREDLERLKRSLRQASDLAAARDLRLALEFQAGSVFCNNLQTAAALVEETASPALGVCLDAFHFFVGPSKLSDLAYLSRENLFHVQLCDLGGVVRELAADADRILPGDGDLDLQSLVGFLHEMNYSGHVSVELMNPQVFQVPALSFGEIAMTAVRKVLGMAES